MAVAKSLNDDASSSNFDKENCDEPVINYINMHNFIRLKYLATFLLTIGIRKIFGSIVKNTCLRQSNFVVRCLRNKKAL